MKLAVYSELLARIATLGSPHRGIDIASFMRHVEDLRATAEHQAAAHAPLPPLLHEAVPVTE